MTMRRPSEVDAERAAKSTADVAAIKAALEADRAEALQVTPEMIKVGADILEAQADLILPGTAYLAEYIYRQMYAASPKS